MHIPTTLYNLWKLPSRAFKSLDWLDWQYKEVRWSQVKRKIYNLAGLPATCWLSKWYLHYNFTYKWSHRPNITCSMKMKEMHVFVQIVFHFIQKKARNSEAMLHLLLVIPIRQWDYFTLGSSCLKHVPPVLLWNAKNRENNLQFPLAFRLVMSQIFTLQWSQT